MAKLIKIDRNGSKHFEGMVTCDRCGGDGIYKWGAMINGNPQYAGVCFKCEGTGKVFRKWIERTPEYQAKLDARRQAKLDAIQAEQDKIRKEAEAERKAEEARIKAQKAISQHVGEVGERLTINGSYVKSAFFEIPAFSGWGTETMCIHTFKDADGNVFIWKTTKGIALNYGEPVIITGTVKEHSEYQDEKQTVLTRCKVKAVATEEA